MQPDPAIEKDVISKASLNADFMNSFLSLLCIEVDRIAFRHDEDGC